MRKAILATILLSTILFSCSRRVTVYFEKETPDIVPSDDAFYKSNYKKFFVKSSNQTVVYSSGQFSSNINILVNTIEKELIRNNMDVTSREEDADLIVEVIGIENADYHTNRVIKGGKEKVYPNCDFQYKSYRAYFKVIDKKGKFINYTFYETPCVSGCSFIIDRNCGKVPIKDKRDESTDGYEIVAKQVPVDAEKYGRWLASKIITQIRSKS